jgi:hypothetical protein
LYCGLSSLDTPHRPTRFSGCGGYPVWYCKQQLKRFHAGKVIDVSLSFVYQWDLCPEPFCQSGNGPWASIVGVNLLNLITYISLHVPPTPPLMRWLLLCSTRGVIYTPAKGSPTALRSWTSQGNGRPPKATNCATTCSVLSLGFFGTVLLLLVYSRCPDGY